MRLRTTLGEVKLFTVIATLGAPLEVTSANLAIETFLPADRESAERLRELAASTDVIAAGDPSRSDGCQGPSSSSMCQI
jgi:hypothetical protein